VLRIGSLCIGFCLEKGPKTPLFGHAAWGSHSAVKEVHARQRKVLTPGSLDGVSAVRQNNAALTDWLLALTSSPS